MIRPPQLRERLQHHRQILFTGETSGVHQYTCVGSKSQPLAKIPVAPLGAEYARIHTQRLEHRVRHSNIPEEGTHQPAGCEDDIKALIDPTDITADEPFAESSHPASNDLRQI